MAQAIKFPFITKNLKSQLFTANGSFLVPAGVKLLYVTGVAPGGGGASGEALVYSGTAQNYTAGGGGGQSSRRFAIETIPAEILTIVIGSVGAGGTGPTQSVNGITYGSAGTDGGQSGLVRGATDVIFRLIGGKGGTWSTTGCGAGGTLAMAVSVSNLIRGGDGQCSTAFAENVAGNVAGVNGTLADTYGYPGRPGGCSLFGASGNGGNGAYSTVAGTPAVATDGIEGVGWGYGGSSGGSAYNTQSGGSAEAGSGTDGGPSFLLLEWFET